MIDIRQIQTQYPHPKPGPPVQLWLLAVITGGGLLALFFAALHAFLLVAGPVQAFFAAALIEAGLVIEALALIRRPKSIYPWLGLAVSFVVSATYNYTQAATAGAGLGNWVLWTLALGPLSALAMASLTLGNELRQYQETVSEWQRGRAEWTDGERRRLERRADRLRARAENASTEPARSQHEPARASITCGDCGRAGFGTTQALNAHRRFCEGRIAAGSRNGHE